MKGADNVVDTAGSGKKRKPFFNDAWLPLRLITLLVFAGLCTLAGVMVVDLTDTTWLIINTGIMSGAVIFGLLSIFLKPSPKKGRMSYVSNKTFGVVSVLLVFVLLILNPYNFLQLTIEIKWRTYLFMLALMFLQAVLVIVYIELLWALSSFQEDPYPFEDERANVLRKVNQLHYLLFLPILVFLSTVFVGIIGTFATFFVFTSKPSFLHSLASGSTYPVFIVGMICLAVLLVILGGLYLWYRFIRTDEEAFLEEEERGYFERG